MWEWIHNIMHQNKKKCKKKCYQIAVSCCSNVDKYIVRIVDHIRQCLHAYIDQPMWPNLVVACSLVSQPATKNPLFIWTICISTRHMAIAKDI